MSNPIKELRKQLRPLVAEHLPEVVKQALFQEILDQVHKRLDKIEDDQKRLISYVIRQSAEKAKLK